MKLLVVASWFPSEQSPVAGIFIAAQARALGKKHDVTVLAPEVVAEGERPERSVTDHRCFRLVRTTVPARRRVHFLAYGQAVAREIARTDCELVHAHVVLPGGFGSALAGLYTRRPVVITEHRVPFASCIQSARDKLKVRFALGAADAVLALSQSHAHEMRSCGIRRDILIMPEVVDTSTFRFVEPQTGNGRRKLLFVGRLNTDQKDLPTLLRAMSVLASAGEYQLRIAGDGSLRPGLESLARSLGLGQMCKFLGTLPSHEVARHMAWCDAFVLPSRCESFGTVLIEAMAVGRPVVATACGGPEDIVTRDTGVLVPVGDHEVLARGIATVCGSLDRYDPQAISEYARKRFGEETVVAQLTDLYAQVLERRSLRG